MESNNGEAKIQKVKNWSPVWIFPIVTALIGAWVFLSLQPSGTGSYPDHRECGRD